MQNSKYQLTPEDENIWQIYTSQLREIRDIIVPKYTYNDETSRKLDLHGFKVNEAWVRFKEFINQHYKNGDKSVVIITGRTGQIAREFSNWCSNIPAIREWEPLSRRNGIVGSFRVYLRQRIRKEI